MPRMGEEEGGGGGVMETAPARTPIRGEIAWIGQGNEELGEERRNWYALFIYAFRAYLALCLYFK